MPNSPHLPRLPLPQSVESVIQATGQYNSLKCPVCREVNPCQMNPMTLASVPYVTLSSIGTQPARTDRLSLTAKHWRAPVQRACPLCLPAPPLPFTSTRVCHGERPAAAGVCHKGGAGGLADFRAAGRGTLAPCPRIASGRAAALASYRMYRPPSSSTGGMRPAEGAERYCRCVAAPEAGSSAVQVASSSLLTVLFLPFLSWLDTQTCPHLPRTTSGEPVRGASRARCAPRPGQTV